MSSTTSTGAGDSTVYVILIIFVLLIVRRLFRVVKGSKVSKGRTIAFVAYYLAFTCILIAVSVLAGGVSPSFLALYAVVGALGIYGAYRFSDSRIGFWKGADGSIYYRGAIIVYVIYVVALITRIVIDLAFIGPQAFTFTASGSSSSLSASAIDAGIVTDLLLALGAGLLTGRNLRVMKRYGLILSGKEQVGDEPPKVTLV